MDHSDDEGYLEIEVSSCSYFSNTLPQNREFEFQMASITNNKETTTSPTDELFFRGRLLPLHQKLLQTEEDLEEDTFCINFLITPIGSPQTCKVSFELNPNDQHLFEWSSNELTTSSSLKNHKISPKKLWSKLIKYSLINQKFKASRVFLKSLFSKFSCSNGNSCSSKDMKVSKKKNSLKNTTNGISGAINNIESLSSRSFSVGEIKWQQKSRHGSSRSSFSTNSSSTGGSFSSSTCSFNSSNGFYELYFPKRSSCFTSEIEGSIEAAVAYCKMFQGLTIPTNKLNVAGMTYPKIAVGH